MASYSPAALERERSRLRLRAAQLRRTASTAASPNPPDRSSAGSPPPVLSPDELEAAFGTLRADSVRPVALGRGGEAPLESGLGRLVIQQHELTEQLHGKLEARAAEADQLRRQLAVSQAEAAAAARAEEYAAKARAAEEEAVCAALVPAHSRISYLEEELEGLRYKMVIDQAEAAEAAVRKAEADADERVQACKAEAEERIAAVVATQQAPDPRVAQLQAALDEANIYRRNRAKATERLCSELESVQLDKHATELALQETAQTADELAAQVSDLTQQAEQQAETYSRSLRRIGELEAAEEGISHLEEELEALKRKMAIDQAEAAKPAQPLEVYVNTRINELQGKLEAAYLNEDELKELEAACLNQDESGSSMSRARSVDGHAELSRLTIQRLRAETESANRRAEAAERERDQAKAQAQEMAEEASLRAEAAKRELNEARRQTRQAHEQLDLWMTDGESSTVVSHSGDTELDDVWDARRNSELEASRAVSAALGERLGEVERAALADREAAANLVGRMAQLEAEKMEAEAALAVVSKKLDKAERAALADREAAANLVRRMAQVEAEKMAAVRKAEADADERVQACKAEAEGRIAAVVATQQAPDPRLGQLQAELDEANSRAEAAEQERDDEIFGRDESWFQAETSSHSDAAAQIAIASALGPAHARIAHLQAELDDANARATTAEKELELYMSDGESSGIESIPEAEVALAVVSKKLDKAERAALADREAAANLVRRMAQVEAERMEAVRKAEADADERVQACKAEAEGRIAAVVATQQAPDPRLGQLQAELDEANTRATAAEELELDMSDDESSDIESIPEADWKLRDSGTDRSPEWVQRELDHLREHTLQEWY